jgi:hypothetical protein
MKSQPIESITINKKKIHWETLSGVAVGAQKYTKTHVSGGGNEHVSSSIETIIEFSIQQDNGNETEIVLRQGEIKVRDGQRVSVIQGHTSSMHSDMIFINHGNNEQYWIRTPDSFFDHLGIFIIFPVEFLRGFITLAILTSGYMLTTASILIWAVIGCTIGVAGIVFYLIQINRVKVAWKIIKPQILEIVRQLTY